MKRFLFPLLAGIATVVSSCSLTDQAQYTPQIILSYMVCTHADSVYTDTLSFTQSVDGEYKMSPIHINDTIRFSVALNTYSNTLVGFSAAWDTSALQLSIDSIEAIRAGLDSTSAPVRGILKFNPGYNFAAFPMHYIPRKAGAHSLGFTVESDSKYSPSTLSVIQPVE